jgi:hypothetical protein
MFARAQKINYMYVKISIKIVFFCFLFVGSIVLSDDCYIEQDRTRFKVVEVSTQFQITKHLNLVLCFKEQNVLDGVLNSRF